MKIGNVETLAQIFNDKETYAVRIKNLNETLKHCLKMKKDTLDYQIWTRLLDEAYYTVLNTRLRTAAKNEFPNTFLSLWITVFNEERP